MRWLPEAVLNAGGGSNRWFDNWICTIHPRPAKLLRFGLQPRMLVDMRSTLPSAGAAGICFVTADFRTLPGYSDGSSDAIVEATIQAMDGGVCLVQYRDKHASRRDLYETARRLREITAQRGVTLIINDHPDIALAVGADGTHLGQDDLPVWVARKLLGDTKIVGVSTHCLEQAVRAEQDGADYIGFGPIFETPTKQAGNPLGIGAIREVKRQVSLPLYAIGGIQHGHLPAIRAAGADGVAAISAFSGDVRNQVRTWIATFGGA